MEALSRFIYQLSVLKLNSKYFMQNVAYFRQIYTKMIKLRIYILPMNQYK